MAMLSNRTGFQYPITPEGKANLLELCTEPSHRIAGDMLTIGFEADPAVVRAYVPEPLELDGSGLVYLRAFNAWVYTDRQTDEFVSPERVNFTEAFFWISCTHEGETYYFMPFSWVNRDWLAFLGRSAGQPHKIAKVLMTRFHPADPVYGSPRAGVRVCLSVECVGLVLRAHVDFERTYEREGGELPPAISHPQPKYLARRFFWDVVADRPLVDDIVAHRGDDRQFGEIWGGPAGLTFHDAENEEVLAFQPRRILGGWWHTMNFHHKQSIPEILHEFQSTLRPDGVALASSVR
jgi:acetoacetate decarboxylase